MGLQATSWESVCLFPGASEALWRKDGRMYGWGILSKCSPMRSSQQTSCSWTRPTLMECATWRQPIWMARPTLNKGKWCLVSPHWWDPVVNLKVSKRCRATNIVYVLAKWLPFSNVYILPKIKMPFKWRIPRSKGISVTWFSTWGTFTAINVYLNSISKGPTYYSAIYLKA